MNKWQLIVLGIMVVAICVVVFTAPKCIFLPLDSGYLKRPVSYSSEFEPSVDWGVVVQRSIPILLIGGLLVLILKKKKP